jgi:hypothetical protein
MRKTIQVYTPIKEPSNIKGYWKDSQGKVYIDNILISRYTPLQFERVKAHLFNSVELAIFYIVDDIAYIQGKGTLERLTRHIILENRTQMDIQGLLNKYSGFTYFIDRQEVHIWQQ